MKGSTIAWIIVAVVIVAGAIYFSLAGNQPTETESLNYTNVSPAEAKALMDDNPDLIVIDVSPDYDDGHLPGAVSYYLGDGSLDAAIPTLDKNAAYLVYCHIPSASMEGAQKLVDAGFKNVYRLQGEYDAWVDAGYSIEQ
jgi:rhodanese-related sulfurtransferase